MNFDAATVPSEQEKSQIAPVISARKSAVLRTNCQAGAHKIKRHGRVPSNSDVLLQNLDMPFTQCTTGYVEMLANKCGLSLPRLRWLVD
ncbi:hypothetical protein AAGR22_15160 [Erwinia sp. HDF1-3R]|uniref:hypothetical protein n=1 Tax=Erwinia sp. HDF1-3R TaxID=3141543 RepID=UPI0031F4C9F3